MKKLSCALAILSFLYASAETPRWLTQPSISPDGKSIAFSYKGEIFIAPASGGDAFQLTSNKAYDSYPIWSPDGKNIVFLSNREGSDDIYMVPSTGGMPKRITFHSGNETPLTFLNDSILLFNAAVSPGKDTSRAPFFTQIYKINVNQNHARPSLFLSFPVNSAKANSDGDLLFEEKKSFENLYRKHEHSAGTSDIWSYSDGNFTKLIDNNYASKNPVWGNDHNYYYITEKNGAFNIVEGFFGSSVERVLTDFEKHPVRYLSISDNGLLSFAWDGDIYTLKPGSKPNKVNITLNADLYDGDLIKKYENRGATELAVSPDGNELAIIIRGDLYVTNSKYNTTKRITDTPAQERTVSFSPDGRTLVYDSDVDGIWQLFTAKIKNDDEKEFAYATDIVIEPLYKCETSAMQPVFSPDGKKVAFLENRTEIKVIDLDSKKVTTALDGKYNYSYADGDIAFSWSPDSEWILSSYMGENGWNNYDIAVSRPDGSQTIDLTESGYADSNPKWALGGKAVTYSSGRYGMKAHGSWGNQEDIILMVLDGDAWDQFNFTKEEQELFDKQEKDKDSKDEKEANDKDKKKSKENDKAKKATKESKPLDFENRRYRTKRLTRNSASIYDHFLSPKGDKLYYVVNSTEGKFNINVIDLKKGDNKILVRDVSGDLVPDAKGENLFILSDGLMKLDLNSGDTDDIGFDAPYDRHPSLERQYIFDHMAKQVEDKFYDKNLHGVDWNYYTSHYREFLPYISNNRDFAILLSEILGELNASHTGGGFYGSGANMQTASLGAYFDENYNGQGLLISEIIPRGPLSTANADLKAGDIILSIDDIDIMPGKEYFSILDGKGGKKVRLGIQKTDGSKKFIYVKPIPSYQLSELGYQRWVERNEHITDSVSNGKVGYVHVKGMNSESFQDVYSRLLGKYRNCDAVVIDTRFNGGGWLHNDLAVLLNGKQYVTFSPRGEKIGIEPFAQWTKPSVMLVNESNYSDAHGSPYAYQALGIGDVVGAPVPGTMTAVWWETQIDPSIYFGIPQVTNKTNDGTILENTQLEPDVLIYNNPADIENGKDAQLEGAVLHLLEIINKN